MKFLTQFLSDEQIWKLKEVIGEDLFNEVSEKAKDFNVELGEGKFIPYNRFKEVNDQAKDLKAQIDQREAQLKELSEKAKGNETLEKSIKDLQAANEKARADFDAQIKMRERDYAIETVAMKNKVRNTKAFRALLNLDGEDLKLDEQVKAIKESDPYLFDEDDKAPAIKKAGFSPNKPQANSDEFADFRKL